MSRSSNRRRPVSAAERHRADVALVATRLIPAALRSQRGRLAHVELLRASPASVVLVTAISPMSV